MKDHIITVTAMGTTNGRAAYAAKCDKRIVAKSLSRSEARDAALTGAMAILEQEQNTYGEGDHVNVHFALTDAADIAITGSKSRELNTKMRGLVQQLHAKGVSVILLPGDVPTKDLQMQAEMALAFG